MSLREYILRSQASRRKDLDEIRYRLPLLNAWTEETVTLDDFIGQARSPSSGDRESLVTLRHDAAQLTGPDGQPLVTDWSLVDQQLRAQN
jgi:hypothetical protein